MPDFGSLSLQLFREECTNIYSSYEKKYVASFVIQRLVKRNKQEVLHPMDDVLILPIWAYAKFDIRQMAHGV